MVRGQPLQQLAQQQRLARVAQIGLHVVQGVQVDHVQAVGRILLDGGHEFAELVEEADVEIVLVRVQL